MNFKSISQYESIDKMLFLVLFSACLQNLNIVELGNASIKPYHLCVIFFILLFLSKLKFNYRIIEPIVFVFLLNVIALMLGPEYGISSLFLNYIFTLALGVILFSRVDGYNYSLFIKSISFAVFPIIIYVFLNLLLNYSSVLEAQALSVHTGARPVIENMVFSGGWNIESTYITMFLTFFIRKKYFFFLYFLSLFIALGYMTRTGFILNVLVLAMWFFVNVRPKLSRLSFYFLIPLLSVLLISSVVLIAYYMDVYVIKRFFEIGNEPGSQGRLDILEYVYAGIVDSNFMGYGPGNTMENLKLLGLETHNDNVHNYFIQLLLDFGLLGFLLFFIFSMRLLLNSQIILEFKFFFMLYLVGALVQFRGAEPVVWFFIFLAYCTHSSPDTTEQENIGNINNEK